jgi:hypothetical protein
MRSLAGSAVVLVLGFFAFVDDRRPPILGWVSLGVHEFGHLLFSWAPELVMVLMGNGTETLLPLVAAVLFVVYKRDWVACGICLAWCATTLQDASVYIADAPYQRLTLLKENTIHDWAYILGAQHLYALDKAHAIATGVRIAGIVALAGGLAACAAPYLLVPDERGEDDVEADESPALVGGRLAVAGDRPHGDR